VLPPNESTRIGIPVGKKVAVKVLKQSDINSYERELNLMSKLTHVNLIPLLACCNHGIDDIEGTEDMVLTHVNLIPLLACCNHGIDDIEGTEDMVLILVYEYMEKGSLDRYVFGI
jgi:serine/threonine protein kinase